MAQPHFICLGAQKAGTRWVYDQFSSHRAFWKPPIKEFTYFNRGVTYANWERAERRLAWRLRKRAKGRRGFDADIAFLQRYLAIEPGALPTDVAPYRALFDGVPGHGFDCTPGYSRLGPREIMTMVEELPETRFFLILRDPTDRLWSHALMHQRLSREPFDPTDSPASIARFAARDSVRGFSFLAETIRHWQALAGARFRLFSFDALQRDPVGFRGQLAEFLGVDPAGFAVAADQNRKADRRGRRPIPLDIDLWLARFFAREYQELAALCLPDAPAWQARNRLLLSQPLGLRGGGTGLPRG